MGPADNGQGIPNRYNLDYSPAFNSPQLSAVQYPRQRLTQACQDPLVIMLCL